MLNKTATGAHGTGVRTGEEIAFTDAGLRDARLAPDVARVKVWDPKLTSFGAIVGRTGVSFFVYRRKAGVLVFDTIGRLGKPGAGGDHGDLWTVKRARDEAQVRIGRMTEGLAPTPDRPLGDSKTLRDAFEAHLKRLEKRKKSPATIETVKKAMRYVEDLLDRPISEVTGETLAEVHARIKREAAPRKNTTNERGAPLANRVITIISACWSTLNKQLQGKLGTWNPAQAVDRDKLDASKKVVTNLKDWHARVETMRSPIQRDALTFALFTGLRDEDVRTIRFEHFDAKAKTLTLPDPKGGKDRAFEIPLASTCVKILERRHERNPHDIARADGGWAFPGIDSDDKVGPIANLRQQVIVEGVKTRLPVESPHSLRRMYSTVAHEVGVSELDAKTLTNHSWGGRDVHGDYIAQSMPHLAKCQAKIERELRKRLGLV